MVRMTAWRPVPSGGRAELHLPFMIGSDHAPPSCAQIGGTGDLVAGYTAPTILSRPDTPGDSVPLPGSGLPRTRDEVIL